MTLLTYKSTTTVTKTLKHANDIMNIIVTRTTNKNIPLRTKCNKYDNFTVQVHLLELEAGCTFASTQSYLQQ